MGFKFNWPLGNEVVKRRYPRGDNVEFGGISHIFIGIVTFSPRCSIEHLIVIWATEGKTQVARRVVKRGT